MSRWGCRLEELLSHALKDNKDSQHDTNEMLRSMLWIGLKPSLKTISGHKYDTLSNFDDLLESLREIESDQAESTPQHRRTATVKQAQTDTEPEWKKEMSEMKKMISKLTTEVAGIKQEVNKGQSDQQDSQNDDGRYSNFPPRSRESQSNSYMDEAQGHGYAEASYGYDRSQDLPTCWRCGQLGHMSYNCKVRMDHSKRGRVLNSRRPMGRGRH